MARRTSKDAPASGQRNTIALFAGDNQVDDIMARVRRQREGRGLFIVGLETSDRFRSPTSTSRDSILPRLLRAEAALKQIAKTAYMSRVIVGNPAVTSPWLKSLEAVQEFGKNCHASGLTRIADVMRLAIETKRQHPGQPVTVVHIGDCFDEDQEEIYSFAGEIRNLGIRVMMLQDRPCASGEEVYRQFAALTDGTFHQPFTMDDPRQFELALRETLEQVVGAEKLKVLR
jgi:hypothetical protein